MQKIKVKHLFPLVLDVNTSWRKNGKWKISAEFPKTKTGGVEWCKNEIDLKETEK